MSSYLMDLTAPPYTRALKEENLREDISKGRDAREPELRERLRKYGLSVPAYRAMLIGQGGKCAGCGEPMGPGKDVVDHCHFTDEVRGLIHGNCNSVLGFANDNPTILRALADYLDRSR